MCIVRISIYVTLLDLMELLVVVNVLRYSDSQYVNAHWSCAQQVVLYSRTVCVFGLVRHHIRDKQPHRTEISLNHLSSQVYRRRIYISSSAIVNWVIVDINKPPHTHKVSKVHTSYMIIIKRYCLKYRRQMRPNCVLSSTINY